MNRTIRRFHVGGGGGSRGVRHPAREGKTNHPKAGDSVCRREVLIVAIRPFMF